jgi:hypothetical protein
MRINKAWIPWPAAALIFVVAMAWVMRGQQMPDARLTPGAANPLVTQANIQQTVCVAGYTARIRPARAYTDKLKLQQMRERGLPGTPADYEEDHRLDLAGGGAPSDPANLWPQPWPEARLKDRLETYTHREMCAGRMTLAQVQAIFLGDFWVAYDRLAAMKHWPPRRH